MNAGPAQPPQIYRLRASNTPTSPKLCRDTIALLLRVSGHPELVETAGLLVSELVTNVSLHTGSLAVRLEAVVRHDRVRVSVYDDEPARLPAPPAIPVPPSSRSAPSTDLGCENGRGLLLVEAMAHDWGVGAAHPSDLSGLGGKHVWFELRDHPAARG
ncbi:ATP-binding protein [Streptomyces sp. ME18-1-4]|uniref:ATP-binding protein n=1 Tax=Streptomyces sp. ME18-1-4 TaxID=3028685 RepID=UPI0029B60547|nr:ATP-binding protein [Streptomyces sp. ME18-1-4]MDX3248781.1 ATP-binding protein [Streptomyces sp. ME18-1-4]